jgi:hypothetical protein
MNSTYGYSVSLTQIQSFFMMLGILVCVIVIILSISLSYTWLNNRRKLKENGILLLFYEWRRCKHSLDKWITENPHIPLDYVEAQTLIYRELSALSLLSCYKTLNTSEISRQSWLLSVAEDHVIVLPNTL